MARRRGGQSIAIAMHPEGFFNTTWTMFKFVLLLFTCSIVPLRLAFPEQFDSNRNLWDVSEASARQPHTHTHTQTYTQTPFSVRPSAARAP